MNRSPATPLGPALARGVYRQPDLSSQLIRWTLVDSSGEMVGEVRLRARFATPDTDARIVQLLDDNDRVALRLMRSDAAPL